MPTLKNFDVETIKDNKGRLSILKINGKDAVVLKYASDTSPPLISFSKLARNLEPNDLSLIRTILQSFLTTAVFTVDWQLPEGAVARNLLTVTGTGIQQSIAHGLSGTPTSIYTNSSLAVQSASADATNVYFTIPSGVEVEISVVL